MHGSNKRVLNSNESAKTNESSAIKRLKKATTVQQSNTLLNYLMENHFCCSKIDERLKLVIKLSIYCRLE